jgi:hypothetical protein
MGTQLLTQKLEMLKQKLDDEQMKQVFLVLLI